MPIPTCSDQEFIELWRQHGSAAILSKLLGVELRSIQRRRRRLERDNTLKLAGTGPNSPDLGITIPNNGVRVEVVLENGTVVAFSDAHYWPGEASIAHKGLVKLLPKIKPQIVIANGDVFDGAQISRHDRIGWDQRPDVKAELETVALRLGEIEKAARGAKFHRTWGNHDLRMESRLATMVPQYEGVAGFTLQDHLPRWVPSWSLMINGNTMVKHRIHNGIHAAYNNTLRSGISTVTGHLHSLKVTPWTDYRGDRYGVDTGCLADPRGVQFDYAEDNPKNWRSGFVVLTYRDGELLPPEMAQVIGGGIFFRGQIVEV